MTDRGPERANLAELLDELEAIHGPVPQEEVDRALAMWPDVRDAPMEPPPTLCRLRLHKWGIRTWPSGERWCLRCGERWSTS